mgnify:CR=1 FL=1
MTNRVEAVIVAGSGKGGEEKKEGETGSDNRVRGGKEKQREKRYG